MRSRYFGPARPITPKKDWLLDGYKVDSYSRNQSVLPAIYLRPSYDPPTYLYYSYIHEQGYPYDLALGSGYVDLSLNPGQEFYDLA